MIYNFTKKIQLSHFTFSINLTYLTFQYFNHIYILNYSTILTICFHTISHFLLLFYILSYLNKKLNNAFHFFFPFSKHVNLSLHHSIIKGSPPPMSFDYFTHNIHSRLDEASHPLAQIIPSHNKTNTYHPLIKINLTQSIPFQRSSK
jgi:hypothetical protein